MRLLGAGPALPDIGSGARKVVTAEMAVARAIDLADLAPMVSGEVTNLNYLRGAVHQACRAARCLDDAFTMKDHCDVVLVELARIADYLPAPGHGRVVTRCLERIEVELARMGSPDSHGLVPAIDDLVEFALLQTQAQYSVLPRPLDVQVSVHHDLVGGNQIVTGFSSDRHDARRAAVSIGLPNDFSGVSYFHLLRAIHHEIFVHSVQALRSSRPRRVVGPNCPVAEGLVDMAAYRSLVRSLNTGKLPAAIAPFAASFARAADRSHGDRYGQLPVIGFAHSEHLMANARRSGANVFDLIVRDRGGDEDAVEFAILAAMALNIEDLGRDQRLDEVTEFLVKWGTDAEGQRMALERINRVIYG